MNRGPRRPWPAGICIALALCGCTRSRPTDTPSPLAAGTSAVAATTPASPTSLAVGEPTDGAVVASPARVAGTATLPPGRQLAAQVFALGADGGLAWLANTRLDVDASGRFSATIPFTVATGTPGIVEVSVADTATGAVYERVRIPVELRTGP